MPIARTPGTVGVDGATSSQTARGPVGSGKQTAKTRLGPVGLKTAITVPRGMRPEIMVSVLVLDISKVLAFLRSVAHAAVMQRHLKIRWVEYNESSVLNAIYTVMSWKGKPGWVEVDTGVQAEMQGEIAAQTSRMLDSFLEKAGESCPQGIAYLEGLAELRQSTLNDVQSTIAEASAIDREVVRATEVSIKRLAVIKLGSDMIVNVGGVLVGAPLWLGLAYSVSGAIIKEWSKASTADAIALSVSKETGKELLEEGGEHVAGKFMDNAQALQKARKKIAFHERVLREARKGKLRRNVKKVARWRGRALGAVKGLTVGIFFAGWAAYDAVNDFVETVKDFD